MTIYNLLEIATGTASIAMLLISLQLHGVKWWLPYFTYGVFFLCLLTMLTAFFMPTYAFNITVVTLSWWAITDVAVVIHSLIMPKDNTIRQVVNRRILMIGLPIIGVIISLALFGFMYKGSFAFLEDINRNTKASLKNQKTMLERMEALECEVVEVKGEVKDERKSSKNYRQKLDKDLQGIQTEQQSQSLRIHKNTSAIQRMGGVVK